MILSPELVARLRAILSLLEAGDTELVDMAVDRLADLDAAPEVRDIFDELQGHRYADARQRIERLLAEGARMIPWEDPEIALLEAEIERIAADLAELEAERAEVDHELARFQAAYHEALGAKIRHLLALRKLLRRAEAERDPGKQSAFEDAQRDFDQFQRDFEQQKRDAKKTNWDLTPPEAKEMKNLFRMAAKRCHPDRVSAEHREAAAELFRQLRHAHDAGDLARVRRLVEQIEAGLFEVTAETGEDLAKRKVRLRARIDALRQAMALAREGLEEIQGSSTYRNMIENPDWDAYFDEQGARIDREVQRLQAALDAGSPPPVALDEPTAPKVEPQQASTSSRPEAIRNAYSRAPTPRPIPQPARSSGSQCASPSSKPSERGNTQAAYQASPLPRANDCASVRKVILKRRFSDWLITTFIVANPGALVGIGFIGVLAWLWLAELLSPSSVSDPQPSTVPARPPFTEPVLAPPPSGDATWFTSQPRNAPFQIRSAEGGFYLVKLEDANTFAQVVTLFIHGGRTEEILVPVGLYRVKYAYGTQWYGDRYLFGPETAYSKADELFRFREEAGRYRGYTITLFRVVNGNLTTTPIPASEF